jgi:hypothetical protein
METPYPRERRVYWIHKPEGEKDLLIFDAGYVGGDIHIYEFKESIPSENIEEEIKSYYQNNLPKEFLKEITRLWVEKNCGNSLYWNLTPS